MKKVDLERVAEISKLKFNDVQLETLSKQLKSMVEFAHQVEKYKADNFAADKIVVPYNEFREDVLHASLPIEKALLNAPRARGRYFVVPIVVD
ncbi:MAG: Asp-tRNA(Asn)/Glu-tRNA(Gln) amidotransferase subunit GatC [Firmicutes bacterium]|nr:Asp-tRNA(Asn)/Glu-tRNA(Gln) amidotransferase subunit GatC [Bacillota bacterium]